MRSAIAVLAGITGGDCKVCVVSLAPGVEGALAKGRGPCAQIAAARGSEPWCVLAFAAPLTSCRAVVFTLEKHFLQAVEGYTRAIDLNPNSAIYHANRAFAHIRLENYGSALADATTATDIDPKYVKVRNHSVGGASLLHLLRVHKLW